MPFIYRSETSEILGDYVDVSSVTLDPTEGFAHKGLVRSRFERGEALRRTRKLLILGRPGIGKTTFVRHCILQAIHHRNQAHFLEPRESPTILYIPLKVVDNTITAPITSYVKRNIDAFRGLSGSKKFDRLANESKLFLILDGYDEISLSGTDTNYILQEIEEMFFGRRFQESRIWLTSRREFFAEQPIHPQGEGDRFAGRILVGIELLGVGDNRVRLVNNIFCKYSRIKNWKELFDAEYFIQTIDNSDDREMRELSRVPLFLTVMCYVYAEAIIEEDDPTIRWFSTFNSIVKKCIQLLLVDLDVKKARDLPRAYREGLLTRRNSWPEEKYSFMKYLSYNLYLTGRSYFTKSALDDFAITYFKTESDSINAEVIAEQIIEGYQKIDFSKQLIFCGVFVLIDLKEDSQVYDFAHRRFREVLAAEHALIPDRFVGLLTGVNPTELTELLLVISSMSEFTHPDFQRSVTREILKISRRHHAHPYYLHGMETWRKLCDGTILAQMTRKFILRSLNENATDYILPISYLDMANRDNYLEQAAEGAYTKNLIRRKNCSPSVHLTTSQILRASGFTTCELVALLKDHADQISGDLINAVIYDCLSNGESLSATYQGMIDVFSDQEQQFKILISLGFGARACEIPHEDLKDLESAIDDSKFLPVLAAYFGSSLIGDRVETDRENADTKLLILFGSHEKNFYQRSVDALIKRTGIHREERRVLREKLMDRFAPFSGKAITSVAGERCFLEFCNEEIVPRLDDYFKARLVGCAFEKEVFDECKSSLFSCSRGLLDKVIEDVDAYDLRELHRRFP